MTTQVAVVLVVTLLGFFTLLIVLACCAYWIVQESLSLAHCPTCNGHYDDDGSPSDSHTFNIYNAETSTPAELVQS